MKPEMVGDGVERSGVRRSICADQLPFQMRLLLETGACDARARRGSAALHSRSACRRHRSARHGRDRDPAHAQADGFVGVVPLALAEEDQLEAEPFTRAVGHIAGVIPPFGAEVFMFEMIAGKLVLIAGQRLRDR